MDLVSNSCQSDSTRSEEGPPFKNPAIQKYVGTGDWFYWDSASESRRKKIVYRRNPNDSAFDLYTESDQLSVSNGTITNACSSYDDNAFSNCSDSLHNGYEQSCTFDELNAINFIKYIYSKFSHPSGHTKS